MISNGGMQSVLDALDNALAAVAVGNGVAPTDNNAMQLTSEILAKNITLRERDGNIQVLEGFFDETEANGAITEFGLKTVNGTMFNFESAAIIKDATQSLTISIEVEVLEVL